LRGGRGGVWAWRRRWRRRGVGAVDGRFSFTPSTPYAVTTLSWTPGEEGVKEVEEVLGGDGAVGVEVGGEGRAGEGIEEAEEEVEEVLGVECVVVVEVGAAGRLDVSDPALLETLRV
jgi:hypothetical protein